MKAKKEWREVPKFTNYIVCKNSEGKYLVRSKKRPKGERMGIKSWSTLGGVTLKENDKGYVTLRQNYYQKAHKFTPEELYRSAFLGEDLVIREKPGS